MCESVSVSRPLFSDPFAHHVYEGGGREGGGVEKRGRRGWRENNGSALI